MHMRTYGPQHMSNTLRGILVLNYQKKGAEFKNVSLKNKKNHLQLFAPIGQMETLSLFTIVNKPKYSRVNAIGHHNQINS